MAKKPTYAELEQRVRELEKEALDRNREEKRFESDFKLRMRRLEELVQKRTAEITKINDECQLEIIERKRAEEELQKVHIEQERRMEERTAELAITNEQLKLEVEEHQRSEEALQRGNNLLNALHLAQSQFISDDDPHLLFDGLLSNLLSLTQSEYGFIGEVFYTSSDEPYLKTHAITNIAWNRETREFYEKNAPAGMEFRNLRSLFGAVMTTGKPVIANDPSTDPRRGGLPEGHPPLDAFLGLPFYSGEKLVGMVGIANRPSGYDAELIKDLGPLLTTCGIIVEAYRNAQWRKEAYALKEQMVKLKDSLIGATLLISGRLDLEGSLRETLSTAKRLSGARYAAFASVENDKIVQFIQEGLTDEEVTVIDNWPKGQGLLGEVIKEKITIRIPDFSLHPESSGFPKGHPPMKSFLGTPIIHGDIILGVIYLTDKLMEEEFSEQDQEIIETFAAHAAVAINNAKLYEKIKEFNLELEERIRERTKELEIAVQAAEVANRTKSDFLASMSHELRTPLNAIIGFSEVLQDKYFGPLTEKQEEYIKDILESGKHLLSLINDILDLSKIEAGKMELELSPVIIKGLLENSMIMIKEKAMKHGISLDLDIPQGLTDLEIIADERKLKQIMFNLLSNATKFTPDGGSITMKARQEGEVLIISVSDTGIGIAFEDQEKVFEDFYQVRNSMKDKNPGTGLGLSLVKNLVEMHGGSIWLESEGEGKGCRFSFVLPLKPGHLEEGLPEEEKDRLKIDIQTEASLFNNLNKRIHLSKISNGSFTLCILCSETEISKEKVLKIREALQEEKRTVDLLGMKKSGQVYLILQDAECEKAKIVCARLKRKIESVLESLKVSWRTVTFPEDGETPEELIRKVTLSEK